jgi:WG containing repeat
MMRLIRLLALLLMAFSFGALATSTNDRLLPHCGGPYQLCGYVEEGVEGVRIAQRFEIALPFNEGLAAVRINGLYGYIDPVGKMLVEPRFQAAGPFTGGYAEVRINDASGIIDRRGRMVIPARFERIIPFADGAFIATPLHNNQERSDIVEQELADLSDSLSLMSMRGQGGLYHIRKGWLTGKDLEFAFFDKPDRGLIWANKRNDEGDEKWGLMRSNGSWQVTPRYNHVQMLSETHAVVTSMPDYSKPPQIGREAIRWGAVDRDGKLVVPLKFMHLSYWRKGYGYAMEIRPYQSDNTPSETREGIVLSDGRLLANRYFDKVDISEDGSLPRGKLGKTWYSITPNGKLIPDQRGSVLLVECANGLTITQVGEKVEFRKPANGKLLGQFDSGFFRQQHCSGPIAAQRNGKWFILTENGIILGGKNGFDNSYTSSGAYIAVQVDGKWGIIDQSGAFTLTPRYDQMHPDRDDKFAIGNGKDTFWINATGDRVEKPADVRPSLTCEGGLRFFQKAGLWGLQSNDEKTVIEPRFRALSCFNQGVSWTATPGENSWCPIGPDGQRLTTIKCRDKFYLEQMTEHYPESFSKDPFESSVLWNRAWLDYSAGKSDTRPRWISTFGGGYANTAPPIVAAEKMLNNDAPHEP